MKLLDIAEVAVRIAALAASIYVSLHFIIKFW